MSTRVVALSILSCLGIGCGSSPSPQVSGDMDDASALDGGQPSEGADSGPATENGGDGAGDGQGPSSDRFVTAVVAFMPADCAGFGAASLPSIVEGPPVGGGTSHGSTDVVSLGCGGSIIVSFSPNAIVDGPGVDFTVFENPFWIGGNSNDVYAEPGEVSVSDDGTTWHTFPCTPTIDPYASTGTGVDPPYGQCAGWHIVYSAPSNGISPFDPSVSGGDPFDLADLGVTHARYVRIADRTHEDCPEAGPRPTTNGFDLDAVAIVNAERP